MQKKKSNQSAASFGKIRFLIVFLLLLMCSAAILFYVKFEDFAERRITNSINAYLSPNAWIETGEFEMSLFPVEINIRQGRLVHRIPFHMTAPEKPADSIRKFEFDEVSVSGIHLLSLIVKNHLQISSVEIDGFRFEWIQGEEIPNKSGDEVKNIPAISVSGLLLKNGHSEFFRDRESEDPATSVYGISMESENFTFDSRNQSNPFRFDQIAVKTESFSHAAESENYRLETEDFELNTWDQSMRLRQGNIIPLKTATELAADLGHQKDTYDFSFDEILIQGLNSDNWFTGPALTAQIIQVARPQLTIHRDRSYPRRQRDDRILPPVQFKNLSFPVAVDSIFIHDGFVSYSEQFLNENRGGAVSFHNIEMVFKNVHNRMEADSVTVDIQTQFMNATPLHLKVLFSMDELGGHRVTGRLGMVHLTELNSSIERLLSIRIQNGLAEGIEFDFHADNDYSYGNLLFMYDDLSIRLLDEETLTERRRDRIRSFFANHLLIRSRNNGPDPRHASIEFERDKQRSMFNYWWRSVSSGLEETIRR